MAGNLRGFALQKAELLSGHLREMLSSGQGYILTHLGVDLGLEPELYPTWLVLSTAAVALLLPLLLLAVSWAAVCGALLSGKRRRSPADGDVCQLPAKATLSKSVNAEQQQQQQQAKKKGRKKAAEKVPRGKCTRSPTVQSNRERLFIVAPKTTTTLSSGLFLASF